MARERVWGSSVFVSLLVSGWLLGACGGADSANDSGGDGDGDSGDGDVGGDSGTRDNIECVAAEGFEDAPCVNETDCDDVESGNLRATAKDCLVNRCLNDEDQAGCTADCLVEQIETSDECSICYGTSAACSAENCLVECISDGDAPECVECQVESGCSGGFFECSGLAQ